MQNIIIKLSCKTETEKKIRHTGPRPQKSRFQEVGCLMISVLRQVLFSSAWLLCRHSIEGRSEQQDQQMAVQEDAF